MSGRQTLRLMLVAGEPSGDALGGALLRELRALVPAIIEATGVGGPAMAEHGHVSLFPMPELSVMGIAEVLPRLPNLQLRISHTVALALRTRPDLLITIDSPDFCFRVARQVRRYDPSIPILHFVAPQVWAWRRGRARKIARYIDHLLALLPFEPPIFEAAGLPCSFVGHPAIEHGPSIKAALEFRQRHGIAQNAPLLTVLPGSRHSEVSRLLAPFGATLALLARAVPDMHLFIATVPSVAREVVAAVEGWPGKTQGRIVVTQDTQEKIAGFAASDAAIAASGTVSLELAAANVPHLIAYRVNPLTALIARRVLNISHVNLINLILDETLIPELLQEACTPANIAGVALQLLRMPRPSPASEMQRAGMHRALVALGQGGERPSLRAARAVLAFLETRGLQTR